MAHEGGGLPELPARRLEPVPGAWRTAIAVLIAVGGGVALTALALDPTRAWRAYLFNWLFWTSIAQGAVMLAAAVTLTRGVWARPVRRIALAFVAFLPISYLLLVPLLFAADRIFPWLHEPVPGKEAWLNLPFLAARNLILLGALVALSLRFAYWALRPDAGLLRDTAQPERLRRLYDRITRGWLGQELEEARAHAKMVRIAPALALLYAVAYSVLAWDFAMSLEPHWFSTLFGPYFFMGAFLGGIAATVLAVLGLRRALGLGPFIEPPHFHDIGKLTFGFCIFWAYLLWSQFLVIWYGLLPHEQQYVIHRLEPPYAPLSLLAFACLFLLPFFGLLGVRPKKTPAILGTFAGVVLFGLWIERYGLVYPSLYPGARALPFGWPELALALPFAGLLLFSLAAFAARFPVLQLWLSPADLEVLGSTAGPPGEVVTAE